MLMLARKHTNYRLHLADPKQNKDKCLILIAVHRSKKKVIRLE